MKRFSKKSARNSYDDDGRLPVHVAAASNNNTGLALILEQWPASAKAKDQHGWTPLHYCADRGNISGIKILLELDFDIDATDATGQTSLMIAQQNADIVLARWLMQHGADQGLSPDDFLLVLAEHYRQVDSAGTQFRRGRGASVAMFHSDRAQMEAIPGGTS